MDQLYFLPEGNIETRWYTAENPLGVKGAGGTANFGRKGAPWCVIEPGQSIVLADIKGPGTIRRIWLTLSRHLPMVERCRAFKIEVFWDNAETPAVQAPLGDFFCHSLGHQVRFENALFSSPEGRSFNSFVPMPFRRRAKVILTNESPSQFTVYYDIAAILGEPHAANMLYFHACWQRENYTQLRQDMTILPKVHGRGRFIGCNIGVRLHPDYDIGWWGEGEVKLYLDDDNEFPTLCGTGTEDYVGSGWGLDHFLNQYQGCHFVSKDKRAYGFYRFHLPDPVYFQQSLRATIQVMGGPKYADMFAAMHKKSHMRFLKAGDGNSWYTLEALQEHPERAEVMERIDDYCATAYWYLDRPENGLPPMQSMEKRMADLS